MQLLIIYISINITGMLHTKNHEFSSEPKTKLSKSILSWINDSILGQPSLSLYLKPNQIFVSFMSKDNSSTFWNFLGIYLFIAMNTDSVRMVMAYINLVTTNMKHTRLTEHVTQSTICDIPAMPMQVSSMLWLLDMVCAGTVSRFATAWVTGSMFDCTMRPARIMGCSLETLRYSFVNY